jgi:hypothetical protein
MAEATQSSLQRHLRGGTAFFGPGYETLRFDLPSIARLTDDVIVEVDATGILIDCDPHANISPANLQTILQQLGIPFTYVLPITPVESTKWNATLRAGFCRPESAQAALNQLNHVLHIQSRLLYTVSFVIPLEIALHVRTEAELIVSRVAVVWTWYTHPQVKVSLRLSGADKKVVAGMKQRLERLFAGRLATIRNRTGHVECAELWHDFFRTINGKAWLRHLSRNTSNCSVVSDDAHHRLRIYTPENMGHVVQQLEQALVDKLEELNCLNQTYIFDINEDTFHRIIQGGVVILSQEDLGPRDYAQRAMTIHCSMKPTQRISDTTKLEGIQSNF